MPIEKLTDHELQIRAWHALLEGGYRSPAYQRIEQEMQRRVRARFERGELPDRRDPNRADRRRRKE